MTFDYVMGIEFIATVLVLLGVYFITVPKVLGIYIMILAQIFWTIFAYIKGAPFLLLQNVILMCFNFRGIRNWKKKGIK